MNTCKLRGPTESVVQIKIGLVQLFRPVRSWYMVKENFRILDIPRNQDVGGAQIFSVSSKLLVLWLSKRCILPSINSFNRHGADDTII